MNEQIRLSNIHGAFLAGLAAGSLLAFGASAQLEALGYLTLRSASSWPLSVLFSALANVMHLYPSPALLRWELWPLSFVAVGVMLAACVILSRIHKKQNPQR